MHTAEIKYMCMFGYAFYHGMSDHYVFVRSSASPLSRFCFGSPNRSCRTISYEGANVFGSLPKDTATSFKFVSMILACTGGGILVPLFINAIPVPLCQDAYPIAIISSFLLHSYFPMLREVMLLSPVFKVSWPVCAATFSAFDSPYQTFFLQYHRLLSYSFMK